MCAQTNVTPNTTPTVHSNSSAELFLQRMEPRLMAREAQYGLMLGIALRVQQQPDFYGENPPYFAVAEDGQEEDGGVAAAASMTPPFGLVVYSEREDPVPGLAAIAADLQQKGLSLPTVNGPEPICTRFAEIWAAQQQLQVEIAVRERTFELREVFHPTYSPGHMRPATLDDLDLLTAWQVAFTIEALQGVEDPDVGQARERMQMRIERGTIFVWEDGKVVSLVGTTRPTEHGITIGPVYTPPQFRGRGYASSCVAAVSQQMLDGGRDFVTLFTDLANPTSNHIYQVIGYRPICDYTVYRFGA